MLTFFSITQQGESHKIYDEPCQDYSQSMEVYIEHLNKTIIISFISDGVGMCPLAHIGSETLVKTGVGYIRDCVNSPQFTGADEDFEAVLKDSFMQASKAVEEKALEMAVNILNFDATLTGVVYDGNSLWWGHIGDDGIVAIYEDKTYKMVTKRHKGEYVNSVYPIRFKEMWQFGLERNVAGAALMTDGVLDYCVDLEMMDNRVYFPFLEPAIAMPIPSREDAELQQVLWQEFLAGSDKYEENFRTIVTDDITFAIVQNSETIEKMGVIEFDIDEWNRGTEEKIKKIEEINRSLYEVHSDE